MNKLKFITCKTNRNLPLVAFLLIMLFSGRIAWGQMPTFPNTYGSSEKYKIIDTAKYQITYQVVIRLSEKAEYSHITYKDVQTLLIGNTVSATYSRDLLQAREAMDEVIRKKPKDPFKGSSGIAFPEDVFKKAILAKENLQHLIDCSWALPMGNTLSRSPTSNGQSTLRKEKYVAINVKEQQGAFEVETMKHGLR